MGRVIKWVLGAILIVLIIQAVFVVVPYTISTFNEQKDIRNSYSQKVQEKEVIMNEFTSCLTRTSIGFHPADYTHVHFRLGYAKEAPTMKFEISGFTIGCGNPDWGGTDKDVFIIKLGKRIY